LKLASKPTFLIVWLSFQGKLALFVINLVITKSIIILMAPASVLLGADDSFDEYNQVEMLGVDSYAINTLGS
jgi:hypothetical protein